MILTVTANAAIDKRYVVNSYDVGEVNRLKSCVANAGGKGINVARVGHLAGEETIATGFLGGHSGEFIAEHVQEQGIRSEFVWCEGESRTCINIWDEEKKEQTEFLEPGFSVTEKECARLLEHYEELLPECQVVTISGSTPKGAGADLYKEMIKKAKERNIPVLLDTSGQLLKDCVSAAPTLIKPNIDEIRQLTGKDMDSKEDMVEAAEMLLEEGIDTIVISLGGDGSLAVSRKGAYEVKVPRIDAVNTVGCGDSMIAGLAAGISRGYSMEDTLRLASAVSAANAMRMETGFIVKDDMEALLPQIEIKQLQL